MTKTVWVGLFIAVGVAIFLSPLASPLPDGLEKVAAHTGFLLKSTASRSPLSFLAGYTFPGFGGGYIGTALAGLFGCLVVFAVVLALGHMLKRKRESEEP